ENVSEEHGVNKGNVTMEDAIEELGGEIWEESDVVRSEVKRFNNKDKYLIQGTYALDKFFDLFEMKHEDEWLSSTVSGFIIEQFERIPHNNDTLEYKGLKITVVNEIGRASCRER